MSEDSETSSIAVEIQQRKLFRVVRLGETMNQNEEMYLPGSENTRNHAVRSIVAPRVAC